MDTNTRARHLRDFFYARDTASLTRAARALLPLESRSAEWQEEEYAFNRLFVGPGHVPAMPCASVWLDDNLVMGKSTLEIRELQHCLGRTTPEDGLPDDFISYELDLFLLLRTLLTEQEPLRSHARAALEWLLREHMQLWIPAFAAAVRNHTTSPLMLAAVGSLEEWLNCCCKEDT